MKKIVSLVLFQLVSFVSATLVYVALFHTPLFARSLFFYRGIMLLVLVSAVLAIVLSRIKAQGRGIAIVIFFCINLVFFTLVPVTADRSVSVFLLGQLARSGKSSTSGDALTRTFIDTYIYRDGAMDKRFIEQVQTGTITRVGDGYRITQRGKALISLYGWISDLFGLGKKNLSM